MADDVIKPYLDSTSIPAPNTKITDIFGFYQSIADSAKKRGQQLNLIPNVGFTYFTDAYGEKQKKYYYSQTPSIALFERRVIIKDIHGVKVPFYQSTGLGQKASVPAGKWYPYFGHGDEQGWFNKRSQSHILNYYDSEELKKAANELDSDIGNILHITDSNHSFERTSEDSINSLFRQFGLEPSNESDSNLRHNIQTIKDKIKEGKEGKLQKQIYNKSKLFGDADLFKIIEEDPSIWETSDIVTAEFKEDIFKSRTVQEQKDFFKPIIDKETQVNPNDLLQEIKEADLEQEIYIPPEVRAAAETKTNPKGAYRIRQLDKSSLLDRIVIRHSDWMNKPPVQASPAPIPAPVSSGGGSLPPGSSSGNNSGSGGQGPKKKPNQPKRQLQQQQNQPFKYESIFETIPYTRGKLDYIKGADFGEYAGERTIRDTIIPFLQSKDHFRNGPDTSIMATEKGRRYKTLYEQAFSKRQFFFDLETTGDAQKTDKAKVYQATLYHYDPTVAGDQVKHYVTDDLHVLQELSKNRGLKPGEALTYYFNLGTDPNGAPLEFGEVPLPNYGKVNIKVYNREKLPVTKLLNEAVYRGGTEQQVVKEEGQAFKAIFGIFDKVWENDPGGAILNVHNSNFDFTQIQLAGVRGRPFKTGEMMMSYFGEGLTPKSTMQTYRQWLKQNKKKLGKRDKETFYDRSKNKNLYRPYAEGNVRVERLKAEFVQAAREARRTKDLPERFKKLGLAGRIVEDGTLIGADKFKGFFEEHLMAMIQHTSTPGAKLSPTDTMNLLKASSLLQQKYKVIPKRGNIALGTSLDLLSIAKSGLPMTHLESTDITKYADIVKNEYENIILPLLANGKLNLEGKRQIYIRERLAKIDNEKNIAESIFSKYQEAISRQKIKVTGELGTKAELKTRVKLDSLDNLIEEQIQYYTQPQTVRSSRVLDKPIRESLEAEHGKDSADIIQRYIEKIDKEYQKKYLHDMSVTGQEITDAGDIIFKKAGYGSGEFQTVDFETMSKFTSEMALDAKQTFNALHTIEGVDLARRSNAMVKAGLDPLKAGRVIDLFDQFRPAFIPITQQVAELKAKADQVKNFDRALKMKVFGWEEIKNGETIVHPPKKTLIDMLKRRQSNARTKLVVGAVIGLGAIAAYNRTEKMMAEDANQKDYQARFDYYLSETGASVNADGSGDYEADVLSSEDKESYSGFDSLNIYDRVLKTDFESPFKAPIVSAPLAKEKMSNNVKQMARHQVDVGYNKSVDHNALADMNRQAQVANHRRLRGQYNMLQTDYNLDG